MIQPYRTNLNASLNISCFTRILWLPFRSFSGSTFFGIRIKPIRIVSRPNDNTKLVIKSSLLMMANTEGPTLRAMNAFKMKLNAFTIICAIIKYLPLPT